MISPNDPKFMFGDCVIIKDELQPLDKGHIIDFEEFEEGTCYCVRLDATKQHVWIDEDGLSMNITKVLREALQGK
jgi:hypothetical protein